MLVPGSLAAEAYGTTSVMERPRHRYEVNNAYRDALTKAGLMISGTSPDGRLIEFLELERGVHPFFVGTQAHPELKSRPTRPHPLFAGFIGAALAYNAADRLPVDVDLHPQEASIMKLTS
jgi:CTP synthase